LPCQPCCQRRGFQLVTDGKRYHVNTRRRHCTHYRFPQSRVLSMGGPRFTRCEESTTMMTDGGDSFRSMGFIGRPLAGPSGSRQRLSSGRSSSPGFRDSPRRHGDDSLGRVKCTGGLPPISSARTNSLTMIDGEFLGTLAEVHSVPLTAPPCCRSCRALRQWGGRAATLGDRRSGGEGLQVKRRLPSHFVLRPRLDELLRRLGAEGIRRSPGLPEGRKDAHFECRSGNARL